MSQTPFNRRHFIRLASAAAVLSTTSLASSRLLAATTPSASSMTTTAQAAKFVYVGSRTTRERNARGAGITVYQYDAETGQAKLIQTVEDLVNPSFLCFDRKQKFLFCVHGDQQEVSALAIDGNTGELSKINTVSCEGRNPVHLSVDPTNRFLAIANYATGAIALIPFGADGKLAAVADLQKLPGEPGPHRIEQASSHPHMIPFDPLGRHVVVPDKGLDAVFVYRVETTTDKPSLVQTSVVKTRESAGPRHVVFAPKSRPFAYVVNELDSTVTAYRYDGESGALVAIQVLPTLPDDFTGSSRAAAIVIAPNGETLYVSNRGHDSIAIFSADSKSGRLQAVGYQASGGRKPRFMTISPDGRFVFAANEDSDNIQRLNVIPEGRLDVPKIAINTGSPVCMIFKTA